MRKPWTLDDERERHEPRAFVAAYFIGVLGETPDPAAGRRELRRAPKLEGRLVVGGLVVDPAFILSSALREMAGEASFALEQGAGPSLAYTALVRPAATSS